MPFTRRDFLKYGALFVSVGVTAPAFITRTAEVAAESTTKSPRTLVVVQLSGGNDGLNTVIPYSDPLYASLRPKIGLPKEDVLPLTDSLAFHGEMTALKDRYDAGQVAVIEGVGYPNPNRSHFRSMEIWQSAVPERFEPTGWLGRYLDANCCGTDSSHISTDAINLGNSLPLAFWTSHVLVPTIGSINTFQFQTDGEYPDDRQNQLASIQQIMAASSTPREYDEFVRNVGAAALETSERIQAVARTYTPSAEYGNDPFSQQMKSIAQLMQADLGTRIYYVALGGFDTHSRQARTQATLLKYYSAGINSFLSDLEAQGKADDVLLLSFSEFGRRAGENGSEGTDHGTAAPLLAIGSKVKGGIHGNPPDLANLVDGDLKFEIDFRSVYSTVLENWLGAKSADVLGGTFTPLPYLTV